MTQAHIKVGESHLSGFTFLGKEEGMGLFFFRDKATGRVFHAHEIGDGFFVSEWTPTGRIGHVVPGQVQLDRLHEHPIVRELMESPNTFNSRIKVSVYPNTCEYEGFGKIIGSTRYESVEACMQVVKDHLDRNQWLRGWRVMTETEAATEEMIRELAHAVAASFMISVMEKHGYGGEGFFAGITMRRGPVDSQTKELISSFLSSPSHEKWVAVRGIQFDWIGTLWGAWRPDVEGDYPTPAQLEEAVKGRLKTEFDFSVRIVARADATLAARSKKH